MIYLYILERFGLLVLIFGEILIYHGDIILDIIVVRSGILYHLIRGFDCNNYIAFYMIFISGLVCYIPSYYYCYKKEYLISTIYHALLHIITGIGLIYLYIHNVVPIRKSYIWNIIDLNT